MSDSNDLNDPSPETLPISAPQISIQYPENINVAMREMKTICLAYLTKEERKEFVENLNNTNALNYYQEYELSGNYQNYNVDRVAQMRQDKENEEKKKEDLLNTLEQRNIILEQNINNKEEQLNLLRQEFETYKKSSEDRFTEILGILNTNV
jgi:hypothetical protein